MQSRRVSFLLGIPIVLGCGGLGLALGMIIPPHGMEPSGDPVRVEIGEPAAVTVAAAPSVDAPQPPEAGPGGHLVASPAPETKADQAVKAPQQVIGPAAPQIEKIVSAERGRKRRRERKMGKRGVASHNANAGRERRGETTGSEPSERSRPLISQIPIVGPVFGFFLQ